MALSKYIKGIHHIGIPVSSMEKTKEFYLGLGAIVDHEKEDSFEGEKIQVTVFRLGDVMLETYERPSVAGKAGAIDHIAFEVDNLETMYQECKEKKYVFMDDCKTSVQPTSYWSGNVRWFIIIGPDGEKLEFSEVK